MQTPPKCKPSKCFIDKSLSIMQILMSSGKVFSVSNRLSTCVKLLRQLLHVGLHGLPYSSPLYESGCDLKAYVRDILKHCNRHNYVGNSNFRHVENKLFGDCNM